MERGEKYRGFCEWLESSEVLFLFDLDVNLKASNLDGGRLRWLYAYEYMECGRAHECAHRRVCGNATRVIRLSRGGEIGGSTYDGIVDLV